MKSHLVLFSALLVMSLNLSAQVIIPGSAEDDYYQLLILKNSGKTHNFKSSIKLLNDSLQWNLWGERFEMSNKQGFQWLSPSTRFTYNSTAPRSYNDGPAWRGKGLTTEFYGGARANYGRVSITFSPIVYFSQNAEFELAPQIKDDVSKYSYQFANKNISKHPYNLCT